MAKTRRLPKRLPKGLDNGSIIAEERRGTARHITKQENRAQRNYQQFICIPYGHGLLYCLFLSAGIVYLLSQQGAAKSVSTLDENDDLQDAVIQLTGSDADSAENIAAAIRVEAQTTTPEFAVSTTPAQRSATEATTPTELASVSSFEPIEFDTELELSPELQANLDRLISRSTHAHEEANKILARAHANIGLPLTPWFIVSFVSMSGAVSTYEEISKRKQDDRLFNEKSTPERLLANSLSIIYEEYHHQNPCTENIFNTVNTVLQTKAGADAANMILEAMCRITKQQAFEAPETHYSPDAPKLQKEEILDRMIDSAFKMFRAYLESGFLASEHELNRTGSSFTRCANDNKGCVARLNVHSWYPEQLQLLAQALELPLEELININVRMGFFMKKLASYVDQKHDLFETTGDIPESFVKSAIKEIQAHLHDEAWAVAETQTTLARSQDKSQPQQSKNILIVSISLLLMAIVICGAYIRQKLKAAPRAQKPKNRRQKKLEIHPRRQSLAHHTTEERVTRSEEAPEPALPKNIQTAIKRLREFVIDPHMLPSDAQAQYELNENSLKNLLAIHPELKTKIESEIEVLRSVFNEKFTAHYINKIQEALILFANSPQNGTWPVEFKARKMAMETAVMSQKRAIDEGFKLLGDILSHNLALLIPAIDQETLDKQKAEYERIYEEYDLMCQIDTLEQLSPEANKAHAKDLKIRLNKILDQLKNNETLRQNYLAHVIEIAGHKIACVNGGKHTLFKIEKDIYPEEFRACFTESDSESQAAVVVTKPEIVTAISKPPEAIETAKSTAEVAPNSSQTQTPSSTANIQQALATPPPQTAKQLDTTGEIEYISPLMSSLESYLREVRTLAPVTFYQNTFYETLKVDPSAAQFALLTLRFLIRLRENEKRFAGPETRVTILNIRNAFLHASASQKADMLNFIASQAQDQNINANEFLAHLRNVEIQFPQQQSATDATSRAETVSALINQLNQDDTINRECSDHLDILIGVNALLVFALINYIDILIDENFQFRKHPLLNCLKDKRNDIAHMNNQESQSTPEQDFARYALEHAKELIQIIQEHEGLSHVADEIPEAEAMHDADRAYGVSPPGC